MGKGGSGGIFRDKIGSWKHLQLYEPLCRVGKHQARVKMADEAKFKNLVGETDSKIDCNIAKKDAADHPLILILEDCKFLLGECKGAIIHTLR